MFRITVIFLLACVASLSLGASEGTYDFNAGYHFDVLDYESEARQFARHRHRYRRGGLELFLSHTLLPDSRHHYLNWYMALGDEEGLSFIGGSYSIRLGSGLFFGPRSYSSGDILSWERKWRDASLARPSGSASPFYSLRGLAAGYRSGSFAFYLFGSLGERYITGEDRDSRSISSSPSSVNSHTSREGEYREVVFLRNSGAALETGLGRYLFLQVFGHYGDITDDGGSRLNWQGTGDPEPLRGYFGAGAALQYRDGVVSAFLEGGVAGGISPRGSIPSDPWAVKLGVKFSHGSGDMSLSLVTTGKGFYSPGSGDSMRPFSRGDLAVNYYLLKKLSLQGRVNSEVHRVPGGWHRSVPVTLRESAGINFKPGNWSLAGEVRHASFEDEDTGWSRRYRLSASWKKKEKLSLRWRLTGQETSAASFSWSSGTDIRAAPASFLVLNGAWTFCRGAAGNRLYVSTGSGAGQVSRTRQVEGTRHLLAAGGTVKLWKLTLRGAWQGEFSHQGLVAWNVDVSCGGKF